MKNDNFYVVVFLGTNGCGKTTLINKLSDGLNISYINLDQIAKQKFSNIENYNEKMKHAAELAMTINGEMLKKKQSFITELTLSNPKDMEFLCRVKNSGAELILIFLLTRDVEINITRVKKRIAEGGHEVPEYKIRERYPKCFVAMAPAIEVSDLCFIYDNSYVYEILLVKREPKKLEVICDNIEKDEWLITNIIRPLETNNQIFLTTNVDVTNAKDLFNKIFTLLSSYIEELKNRFA